MRSLILRLLALVGSHARSTAGPDSDIDLVLLADDPYKYMLDTDWVEQFGLVERSQQEDYGRLDVLVNNAGYALYGLFESLPADGIQRQFEANLFGMLAVTRAVLPIFRRQGGGTIVNLSSMGGRIAFPLYSVYNSSKFAVEGFTESLQYELRPLKIRVKLVEPGVIKTDFYGSSMQKAEDPEPESAYGDFVRRADRGTENTGLEPRAVARAIYRAALDTGRRLRYVVGLDARMVAFLRWLLPQRMFSWMFEKLILN